MELDAFDGKGPVANSHYFSIIHRCGCYFEAIWKAHLFDA
jgi:hypothetical protein